MFTLIVADLDGLTVGVSKILQGVDLVTKREHLWFGGLVVLSRQPAASPPREKMLTMSLNNKAGDLSKHPW